MKILEYNYETKDNATSKLVCNCYKQPTGRGSSPLALRLTFTSAANSFANRPSFKVPCT